MGAEPTMEFTDPGIKPGSSALMHEPSEPWTEPTEREAVQAKYGDDSVPFQVDVHIFESDTVSGDCNVCQSSSEENSCPKVTAGTGKWAEKKLKLQVTGTYGLRYRSTAPTCTGDETIGECVLCRTVWVEDHVPPFTGLTFPSETKWVKDMQIPSPCLPYITNRDRTDERATVLKRFVPQTLDKAKVTKLFTTVSAWSGSTSGHDRTSLPNVDDVSKMFCKIGENDWGMRREYLAVCSKPAGEQVDETFARSRCFPEVWVHDTYDTTIYSDMEYALWKYINGEYIFLGKYSYSHGPGTDETDATWGWLFLAPAKSGQIERYKALYKPSKFVLDQNRSLPLSMVFDVIDFDRFTNADWKCECNLGQEKCGLSSYRNCTCACSEKYLIRYNIQDSAENDAPEINLQLVLQSGSFNSLTAFQDDPTQFRDVCFPPPTVKAKETSLEDKKKVDDAVRLTYAQACEARGCTATVILPNPSTTGAGRVRCSC